MPQVTKPAQLVVTSHNEPEGPYIFQHHSLPQSRVTAQLLFGETCRKARKNGDVGNPRPKQLQWEFHTHEGPIVCREADCIAT